MWKAEKVEGDRNHRFFLCRIIPIDSFKKNSKYEETTANRKEGIKEGVLRASES